MCLSLWHLVWGQAGLEAPGHGAVPPAKLLGVRECLAEGLRALCALWVPRLASRHLAELPPGRRNAYSLVP